jgi:5-methyltetrahydropteroyltriglutamate--homocysteine methyltransferase
LKEGTLSATPKVTVVGAYPRPPLEGGEFRLRKTLQALDRGQANEADVRASQDDLVREIIAEQAAAGVDVVTDGQVRWEDAQTRLAQGLDGFSIGGLIRYFDNNTYFRQPTVKAEIGRPGPILADELRFAVSVSDRPVKAVLVGPYTMAVLSRDDHYGDLHPLVRDLAGVLNAEARDLAAAGAAVVQFDEPALARVPGQPPGDLAILAEVAEDLVEGIGVPTQVQTYFGDVAALGPEFFDLPFDIFGLDLVAGGASADLLGGFPSDRELCAGIVDGRNTKLEPIERLLEAIAALTGAVPAERLWLSPSSGLDFLPREAAQRKLQRLGEAARAAGEATT